MSDIRDNNTTDTLDNSDTQYNTDNSSSFDSTNSFYSTTTSSDSDNSLNSFFASIIEDQQVFNKKYNKQVSEKVDLVLKEISRDDNFQPLLDLPTVKVDTSINPATPLCFRAAANFTGQPAAAAFALFAAIPQRPKWDAMCQSIQVLKTIDPLTFIYHLKLKATWPTAQRDSLMFAAFRKLTDGRFISVAWSITDDSLCPADPAGTYIRMHTRISANLFTPTSPTSFTLTQLIDADPKGSIPAYIIKKVSSKSFPDTIKSIKRAIVNDDKNFYSQIIKSLKSPDNEDEIESNESDLNITFLQLREIQSRLDRIENHLQSINTNNTKENSRLIQYAPLAISAVSLLLLLNLNLRKK